MLTIEMAADIFIHYFAQLASQAGAQWTEDNSSQIRAAVRALAGDDSDTDAIPPYVAPADRPRMTVLLDHTSDPDFLAWRDRRRADVETQRRLMREANR
jgi:hypothetical protein